MKIEAGFQKKHRIFMLFLVSSFCCPLRAQNNDYVSSSTNVTTLDTKVVISAPLAVFTKSLDIFTTGISIHPVYIQAPPGLYVGLSIHCKGGAARLSLPDYVANLSWTQTDRSGEWHTAAGALNASDGTYLVTGVGIRFNQNISVCNDVLTTLTYGKGADNDIAGKATMTIGLNWTITILDKPIPFLLQRSKRITILAPTSLTSISTFRATVSALCLLGIFILCCLCCLNTVAVSSLRRFSVFLARETRDQQECEQNRVFNPLWMPCAPTLAEHNNIDSTPNPLMMMQRRKELKTKILRMTTPLNLMERVWRARHVKTSDHAWGCPCAPALPPPRDSSSDDERPATSSSSKSPALPPTRDSSSDDERPTTSSSSKSPPSSLSNDNDQSTSSSRMGQLVKTTNLAPKSASERKSSIMARDSQISSKQAVNPPQSANPTLPWRPPPQRDIEKYPAERGVYLRNQYNQLAGNHYRSGNITVGYAFVQHKLAPQKHGPAAKPEVEEEQTVAESTDLEFGSGSSSPSSLELAGSGRTSFRSPISDLYEDVLESCCSPASSSSSCSSLNKVLS